MSNKCLYFVVMLLPYHINAERSSGFLRTFAGKFSPLLHIKAAITGKKDGVKVKSRLWYACFIAYCTMRKLKNRKFITLHGIEFSCILIL